MTLTPDLSLRSMSFVIFEGLVGVDTHANTKSNAHMGQIQEVNVVYHKGRLEVNYNAQLLIASEFIFFSNKNSIFLQLLITLTSDLLDRGKSHS